MEQRLSLITLGVRDLARSRAFYADGMGWTPSELSNENIVFFLSLVIFAASNVLGVADTNDYD